jgi:hypothetical protein
MTSFLIHISDPEPQNLSQAVWVWLCKAATVCPWTAYQCAQTLCICLIWMREAVWVGGQPQPWCNDIMLTPHVTQNPPKKQEVWVWLCKAATVCLWTAYQCAQTLCICLIWMREAVWGGGQPQPWCNDIMLTPHVTQNPPKKQEVWVWLCKAATVCLWTAYQCAETLCIHLIWMR